MFRVPDLVRKLKSSSWFGVTASVVGTAAATAANYPENVYVHPANADPVRLIGVRVTWTAGSTSGTVDVRKIPSGTALASGTSMLSSTVAMSGTANTPISGSLATTEANLIIGAGDRIGLVAAGTLTNQTGVGITLQLQPLEFAMIPAYGA